jgi:thymidylate synthase
MLNLPRVNDIRQHFKDALTNGAYVTDKSGVKTLELCGASFFADEEAIFGKPNYEYINAELQWYDSRSLNVNDIPGGAPKIWKQVATKDGRINSNYGWCIYSETNYKQYNSARNELIANPNSRRAIMIYTRPTMHKHYCEDGCSDFMCTNAVQYLIRGNKLHALVQMRSNDVVFGYKNDRAWQYIVQTRLLRDLNILGENNYEMGDLIWHVASLHVYERHFPLING